MHQAAAMKDLYEILGVDKDVTTEQIKKSYYRLSLKWHPDKNKGDKVAEQMFMELAAAYELLSASTPSPTS
jgi:curved DNA-binding protein CbpA